MMQLMSSAFCSSTYLSQSNSTGKPPCTSSLTATDTPTMLDTPTNDSRFPAYAELGIIPRILLHYYSVFTTSIFSKGRWLFKSKPGSKENYVINKNNYDGQTQM